MKIDYSVIGVVMEHETDYNRNAYFQNQEGVKCPNQGTICPIWVPGG